MTVQQLITKFRDGGKLTADERGEVVSAINADLSVLKEKDPEKYVQLLENLTEFLESLAKDLKK